MNPEVKAKWLAALRSGEYRQGSGQLYNPADDSYCCLGVLCELARQEGVAERKPRVGRREGLKYGSGGESTDWSWSDLPPVVAEWSGTHDENPRVLWADSEGLATASLMALNDSEGLTFEQIADLIEEQL